MKDLLYISHNLFLSEKQRYELYSGRRVVVVGSSLSVRSDRKSTLINGHSEQFNKYFLIPTIFSNRIKKIKSGYKLYLINKNSIFNFLNKNEHGPSLEKLLNIKDKGSEWMFFTTETEEKNYTAKHTIEIQKIENLLNTI